VCYTCVLFLFIIPHRTVALTGELLREGSRAQERLSPVVQKIGCRTWLMIDKGGPPECLLGSSPEWRGVE